LWDIEAQQAVVRQDDAHVEVFDILNDVSISRRRTGCPDRGTGLEFLGME